MAIQVSGTQVIGNSRELTNIASVDATTAASIGAAGVGGASTTQGAVGTYIWGRPQNTSSYAVGTTASSLYSAGFPNNNAQARGGSSWYETFSQQHLESGTWRAMTNCLGSSQGLSGGFACLWARIS